MKNRGLDAAQPSTCRNCKGKIHRCNLSFSCRFLALIVCLFAGSKIQLASSKRICLVPASLPWVFGPYQTQMYRLSQYLATQGHDILWMSRHTQSALPEGIYDSWEEISRLKPGIQQPPEDFDMKHLKFVGRGDMKDGAQGLFDKNALTATLMNHLAMKFDIDSYITLMDIGQMIPDVDFMVPVVAWMPLHAPSIHRASLDYWSIRHYHAVASLAPSMASSMLEVLPERKDSIKFVPHIIERNMLERRAQQGSNYLRQYSPKRSDLVISGKAPQSTQKLKNADKPIPYFSGKDDTTFLVLMQGGNYDSQDRKGWDTSLQAYAKFYEKYFGDESASASQIGSHLYIHTMESYMVEADMNDGKDAPPVAYPHGVLIKKRIYETGLPRSAYTYGPAQHEVEIVAALKKRASVCLHASKVEGFGMNVLECEALGTPVITTNHTAMGDFTKLGISVPPRQMQYLPGGTGLEFALPYVDGLANALGEMYEQHVLLQKAKRGSHEPEVLTAAKARQHQLKETQMWLDDVFSLNSVGRSFDQLLVAAERELEAREEKRFDALANDGDPPSIEVWPMFQAIGGGRHIDIVDFETPWTLVGPPGLKILREDVIQAILWKEAILDRSNTVLMVIPVKDASTGETIPFQGAAGLPNPDVTFVIRTYMMTIMQNQMSRRSSIVAYAVQHATSIGAMSMMDEGLAVLDRKNLEAGSASFSLSSVGSEL